MGPICEIVADNPLVSIIVVCHNHPRYIVSNLDSIRNQTYSHIQLIIINNLLDECEKIIKDWIAGTDFTGEITFIQNQKALGVCPNLNLGLDYVKGDYFQLISADDILLPEKIEKQVSRFFQLDQSYAAVYSDMAFIDAEGIIIRKSSFELFNDSGQVKANPIPYLFRGGKVIPSPTLLMKTEIIRKTGGYSNEWPIEDWPVYFKLAKLGYKFKLIDEVLVQYRVLPDGLGKKHNQETLLFCISLFENNLSLYNPRDKDQVLKWFSFISQLQRYSVITSVTKFLRFFRHLRNQHIYFLTRYIIHLVKSIYSH
jgi:glycosyltransferase involved in cell wall biosynthesis